MKVSVRLCLQSEAYFHIYTYTWMKTRPYMIVMASIYNAWNIWKKNDRPILVQISPKKSMKMAGEKMPVK